MKALLAEDKPEEQIKITQLLENSGYQVTVVDTGREALQYALTNEFSLYVIDNALKDAYCGTEVAAAIRKINRDVPIIMNSSGEIPALKDIGITVNYQKNPANLANLINQFSKAKESYDTLPPATAFLEYSLEILHSALTPAGFSEAEKNYDKLEKMLNAENADANIAAKVAEAKTILTTMQQTFSKNTDAFTDKYTEPLSAMRDILLDTQEIFEQTYNS